MGRWRASAKWLAGAALLSALGCRQDPDVVAKISWASVEPVGGNGAAGAGSGGAGTGDTGVAGAGRGGSAAAGTGGGVGTRSPTPDAGSPVSDAGAMTPERPCPNADFYQEVVDFTDSDCWLRPDLNPAFGFLIATLVPVPLMGETREPAPCEIVGSWFEARRDEDGDLIGGGRLCINWCDAARNWLVTMREASPCLQERFPADAGTAVPADAGTDS